MKEAWLNYITYPRHNGVTQNQVQNKTIATFYVTHINGYTPKWLSAEAQILKQLK